MLQACRPLSERAEIPVSAAALERLAHHVEQRLVLVVEVRRWFIFRCHRRPPGTRFALAILRRRLGS